MRDTVPPSKSESTEVLSFEAMIHALGDYDARLVNVARVAGLSHLLTLSTNKEAA